MPESVEGRLLRVEERTARVAQRVEDLSREVSGVVPLVRELGEVIVEVRSLKEDLSEVRVALTSRDVQATEERRSVRVALIGLSAVILAALIAATATIIASGVLG